MSVSCLFCDVSLLSDPSLFSRGMAVLPWEERRKQVIRYRFEKDRHLCLGAGLLLAYALRRAGASNTSLRNLPNGKPVLAAGPDIHFSLSHSGKLAVCAVSGQPVGVDVEVLHSADRDVMALCFQKQEQEWITQSNDPGRAYTRLWTRKESYLKRTGTGMACDLRAFSVLPGRSTPEGIAFYEHEEMNCLICVCAERSGTVTFEKKMSVTDLVK